MRGSFAPLRMTGIVDLYAMTNSHPNYLVIRLSSIGDIVHALPAVSALGETFPWARITWVIEDRYARLLQGNPFVSRVITVDTLGWRNHLAARDTWARILSTIRRLRDSEFDAVLDFQGLVKSGVIARLCRSRSRVGFASPWLKEAMAASFYNQRVHATGAKHAIQENLALVASLGAHSSAWRFPLPCSQGDKEYIDQLLARGGVAEFMILNPGGGWVRKRWPPAYYAELIRRLGPIFSGSFILTGSASEADVIRKIVIASGSARARYFPTSIEQFIALARSAKLFVGGDTGPLHLAAALGAPIVALYGPTDPARNGPFSQADVVLSTHQPVNHTRRGRNPRFLEEIPVSDALEAVRLRLTRADEE
ncbi:MAG TPA: lipopolysaccharide heptosyltransferase I [Terriglobia bacterium]|nr:lipopolysaccharide heptosyltransferase I [Terriglobia bacterium]